MSEDAKHGRTSTSPDPAATIRRAWDEVPLEKLQRWVRATIKVLDMVEPERLLGRDLLALEVDFPKSAVADALEACRSELREECGMPESAAQRAVHCEVVRRRIADNPEWTEVFRKALGKYRDIAGHTLELSRRDLLADPEVEVTLSVAP